MKYVHHISNSGYNSPPPKSYKSDGNTRKNARFRAEFTSVNSCSLRALPTALSMQNNQPTLSSVASQLLAIMTIGSVAGTVIPRRDNASFPHSFSGGQNTAHRSAPSFDYCPADHRSQPRLAQYAASLRLPIAMNSAARGQPSQPVRADKDPISADPTIADTKPTMPKADRKAYKSSNLAAPRPPQQIKQDSDFDRFTVSPTPINPPLPGMVQKKSDQPLPSTLPHPPLSAAANSMTTLLPRSFSADLRNMLGHMPLNTYLGLGDRGNSIGGVEGVGHVLGFGPSNTFLGTQWWTYAHKLEEEGLAAEKLKMAERKIFMANISKRFNPLTQNIQAFFREYLIVLFESYGLHASDIDIPILASYYDMRNTNVASAHMQPKQLQPILYEATWSVQDIATGKIFHEIKENAGPVAAHMYQITIHWPAKFPPRLKHDISKDALWDTLGKYMEECLASGPLVDDAQKNIKAVITGILAYHYKDLPELAEKLEYAIKNIRSIRYREDVVTSIFTAPSFTEGVSSYLFSMNDAFQPIPIDSISGLPLRNPVLQAAIRQGLPLKAPAKWGEYLFSPYMRNKYFPMQIAPHLLFSEPGKAANIMWPALKEKIMLDTDFSVFSKDEQNQLLALEITQTTLQATIVVMGPPLSPWVTTAIGVLTVIPEGLKARIVDDPQTAQMHITYFFAGLVIEAVGMAAYVGNQGIIKRKISSAAAKLIARPEMKDVEISKLMEWAKQTIPSIPPKAAIFGGRLIGKTADQIRIALTQSDPSTVTQRSGLIHTPHNGHVNVPSLTRPASTAQTWDALSKQQKAHLTLADMLTGTENLSPTDRDLLLLGWEQAIVDTFTTSGIKPPQVQAEKLSEPAHKFLSAKYALMEQDGNLTRAEALVLAHTAFALPPDPLLIDRIYFYALEPWMQEYARDTQANDLILAHPSAILRARLLLNTPERIDDFLCNLQESRLFNNPALIQSMRTHPSPMLATEMLQFSIAQVDHFLDNFDEWAVVQIGTLYSEALLYEYCRRADAKEGWGFNAQSHIAEILARYKRALGVEQAIPYMIGPVLNALRYTYDSQGLSGSYEQYLSHLHIRPELDDITGYTCLTDKEQIRLFNAVAEYTGLSKGRRLGSLLTSAERILRLFPNGKGLSKMHHPEGDVALFNQLIAWDLAMMHNVRTVDTPWAEDIWRLMLGRRETIPDLGQWLDKLMHDYPVAKKDRIIAAINSMHDIARSSPSETTSRAMIDFAIQLTTHTLRRPYIDGDSPGTKSGAINAYLAREIRKLDNPPQLASIQEWKQWVEAQAPNEHNQHERSITAPNQQIINDTLARIAEVVGWPHGIEMVPTLRTTSDEDPTALSRTGLPENIFPGALVLVQSGFKNVNAMIDGVKTDIQLITNENRVAPVYEVRGAWYDGGNFKAVREDDLSPMLAKDKLNNRFYSDWPNEQVTLEVAGRNISNDPAVKRLPSLLSFINDFSDRNGTAIFDKTFNIKPSDVADSACNPRTLFGNLYDKIWLFRGIVNAAELYLGKWEAVYGQPQSIDPTRNIFRFPWDRDLEHIQNDIDLTGAPQEHSLKRMYLQQWMNILLQKEDKPGLNSLITNMILQQAGLEQCAYDPMNTSLLKRKQIRDFNYRLWLAKNLDAKIKMMVPPEFQDATFTCNPAAGITIQQLNQLPILQKSLSFFPTNAISVEARNNSIRYLDDLNQIYLQQYVNKGLFSQLMSTFKERISADNPWHFIYLEPSEKSEKLTTYGASHYLDQDKKIVYLVNTDKQSVFYLSRNGLTPLTPTTQAMIIMMEILTGAQGLNDEQARNNRGMAVLLASICLVQTDQNSPLPIAAAMINASHQAVSLLLLQNCIVASRRAYDENQLLKNSIRHPDVRT
ncbi:hypothetical protein ACVBEF_06080 [Glaciimonas sp. GG7]